MSNNKRVLMCGLPASGKTTYIGALWHCISSGEVETSLVYDGMPDDREHLNKLSTKWLQCEEIEHTRIEENEQPEIKFRIDEESIKITFPDQSGEIWSTLWESRHSPKELLDLASETIGIILFIHVDTIKHPVSVVEVVEQAEMIGEELDSDQKIPYSSEYAPTQVKLVDILQSVAAEPFWLGNKPLSVILSAWDLVEVEKISPAEFLKKTLPFLHQYLCNNSKFSKWNVYGVSALGGDLGKDIEELMKVGRQSERIKVIDDEKQSHDLTRPILWLMDR